MREIGDIYEQTIQRTIVGWWEQFAREKDIPIELLFSPGPDILLKKLDFRYQFEKPKYLREMLLDGYRRGTPDLFLLLPNSIYSFLALELKGEHGEQSDSQKSFEAIINQNTTGLYRIAYSIKEAKVIISDYINLREIFSEYSALKDMEFKYASLQSKLIKRETEIRRLKADLNKLSDELDRREEESNRREDKLKESLSLAKTRVQYLEKRANELYEQKGIIL